MKYKNFKLNNLLAVFTSLIALSSLGMASNNLIKITPEKAQSIAKEHSNFSDDAKIEIKMDKEDGKLVYELRIYDLNKELEYEIDAESGKILEFSQEDVYRFSYRHNPFNEVTYENKPFLSKEEVKKIALSKVKGATENDIYKFKTDINDDVLVYEIIIILNGTRFEFDLNAQSGEVISWEEESIGR